MLGYAFDNTCNEIIVYKIENFLSIYIPVYNFYKSKLCGELILLLYTLIMLWRSTNDQFV